MIEGYPPFSAKQDNEVPKVYAARERPPFKAPAKHYAHGLKEWVLRFGFNNNYSKFASFF